MYIAQQFAQRFKVLEVSIGGGNTGSREQEALGAAERMIWVISGDEAGTMLWVALYVVLTV